MEVSCLSFNWLEGDDTISPQAFLNYPYVTYHQQLADVTTLTPSLTNLTQADFYLEFGVEPTAIYDQA